MEQPRHELRVHRRVGALKTKELAPYEEAEPVGRSPGMIGSVALAEVDTVVGAESTMIESSTLPHVGALLAVAAEEGAYVQLGLLHLDPEQAGNGHVKDGKRSAELPYSHEDVPLALLVHHQVDASVV